MVEVLRNTYSESGDTSDMLWDVVDWGGEGEGPWTEPLGLEGTGGVRTEEPKDAKMEDRMSSCSLDGCLTRGFGFRPETWGIVWPGYLHEGAESRRPLTWAEGGSCSCWGSSEMGGGGEAEGGWSGCEGCRGGRLRSHSRPVWAWAPTPLVSSSSLDLLLIREPPRCSRDEAWRRVSVFSCDLDPLRYPSIPAPTAPPFPLRSSLEVWKLVEWWFSSLSLDPDKFSLDDETRWWSKPTSPAPCPSPSSLLLGKRSRLSLEPRESSRSLEPPSVCLPNGSLDSCLLARESRCSLEEYREAGWEREPDPPVAPAVAEYMRPYEAAGTPRWPSVEVRYQLSSLGTRPIVERPWSAGGHPRRFFRIPARRKKHQHERKRRDGTLQEKKKYSPVEKGHRGQDCFWKKAA